MDPEAVSNLSLEWLMLDSSFAKVNFRDAFQRFKEAHRRGLWEEKEVSEEDAKRRQRFLSKKKNQQKTFLKTCLLPRPRVGTPPLIHPCAIQRVSCYG